jgi:hypothetical protein
MERVITTGKFSAKSNAWEDNKVLPEGEELVIKVKRGPLVIEKRPAPLPLVGPGAIAAAGALIDEILAAP